MNERLGKRVGPYIWLLPSILLMAIFVVFPIAIVFKLSFSEVSKSGVVVGFIVFKNFADAVSLPAFKTVMLNTLVWVIAVVGFSTVIGFIVAMVLNQKFRGRKIARGILVFPWATSLVIQASVWNYIIKYEYGNLNNILLNLGIIKQAINWRATYQIEFLWECGVGIFVTIPFVTFCVLSGLQSIDGSLYEAAEIDGASKMTVFFKIIIPLSRPIMAVMVVFSMVAYWNDWFTALIYMKGSQAPLPLVLRNILIKSSASATQASMISGGYAELNKMTEMIKFASIIAAAAPMLVIYPFVQKYFEQGFMAGAVKG